MTGEDDNRVCENDGEDALPDVDVAVATALAGCLMHCCHHEDDEMGSGRDEDAATGHRSTMNDDAESAEWQTYEDDDKDIKDDDEESADGEGDDDNEIEENAVIRDRMPTTVDNPMSMCEDGTTTEGQKGTAHHNRGTKARGAPQPRDKRHAKGQGLQGLPQPRDKGRRLGPTKGQGCQGRDGPRAAAEPRFPAGHGARRPWLRPRPWLEHLVAAS